MKKPTLMFVSSSDFDAVKSKGVDNMFSERSEGGYFGRIISIHPLARKSRTIEIDKTHQLVEFGFDFFPGGSSSKFLRYIYSFGYVLRSAYCMAQLIRSENVDIVRASDPYWAALISWLAIKISKNIPFVISIHADWDKSHELDPINGAPKLLASRFLAKILCKFLLNKANRVFCIRKTLFRFALLSGANRKKLRFIPHGLDLSKFKKNVGRVPDDRLIGKKIIFFAGRLSRENYVDDILELGKALNSRKNLLFVIAGSGPEGERLRSSISQNQVLNQMFYFLGSIPRDLVQDFRKFANINLVLRGGYALIEACASGKPTVSYNVDWHAELIEHSKSGWLVPEGDAGLLKSTIESILDNEQLGTKIGRAGQRRAFHLHDFGKVFKIRAGVYEELLREFQ